MRFFSSLLVVSVASLLPTTIEAQTVTVVVTNADAIVASLPDVGLTRDVLRALGERSLSTVQFHKEDQGAEPVRLVMALIALAAPDEITKVEGRGSSIVVSPVPDFESFVAAIDYGQVEKASEADRRVKVAIDPKEVAIESLRARRDAHPNPPTMVRSALGFDREDAPSTLIPRRHSSFGEDQDEPDDADRLGGSIEPGDAVELDLGKAPYAARILEVEEGSFGERLARVAIADKQSLVRAIRNRRLKTRLEKAGEFAFWVNTNQLRKLAALPAVVEERTWTDTTGKYRIVATYRGVESGKVRLEKASGKSSLVPLAKLSEADREYVKQQLASADVDDNPFADRPKASSRSLRADWSDVEPIRKRNFRGWEFNPAFEGAPEPARLAVESLDVTMPVNGSRVFKKIEALHFAPDAGQIVVHIVSGVGRDEKQYLQLLDFTSGYAQKLVACPKDAEVLDVRVEERLVLMRVDSPGRNNGRIYTRRLTEDGLEPLNDWDALPPDSFHKKLEEAHFVAGDRLLTKGFAQPWIVWDRERAKAVYRFDGDEVTLGPHKRFAFVRGRKDIAVIDLVTGDHLASSAGPGSLVRQLKVNDSLTRMALSTYNLAAVIDLTTGKLLNAIQGSLVQRGNLDFVGDLLLLDHEYLVEPYYPILLWQYVIATGGGGDTHATVRAGRLWYATRQRGDAINDDGVWTIASIEAPHATVKRTLASVGDLEDLVILDEGDAVTVAVETDQGDEAEEKLRRVLSEALNESGFKVIDESEADDNTKQAVLVYERAEEPIEVLIADPNAKPTEEQRRQGAIAPPAGFGFAAMDWMYARKKVRPFHASVVLRQGDDILWTDNRMIREGQRLHPRAKETVEDVIQRVSKQDPEVVRQLDLPGRMCKAGTATASGAYGASLLDAEGVATDYTGE